MTERDIFLALIDLPDAAARSAYLDRACGGDANLRGRVEALVRSHEAAGSFLANPAVTPHDPEQAVTRAFDPNADTASTRTNSAPDPEDLSFLEPPGRPDSLGRIGHYEVLEVLGRGGFGIVFRAFDDVLQRVVAVKVLAPQMAATSPARKRFVREARAAAPIRHENVVAVHAIGEQPLPYLVMEFIPGETLQEMLDRHGPLDVSEVLRIGRQVAEGLAAAHAVGVIHRDIKPGNVLIEGGPQRRAKITDFGLARAADDASLSTSGVVAGTPMYMAPEQAKGETLDHRADLFSLGSVFYVMLTGRPPFRAETTLAVLRRVAEEKPRPIREVIPEVPEWLCRIVEKLHAKDPAARFQTAAEVAQLLEQHHSHLQQPQTVPMPSPVTVTGAATPAKPRRRRLLPAVALLVLAGMAAFAVWYGTKRGWENTYLYLTDRSVVRVTVGDPIEAVTITKDGKPVETIGSGLAIRYLPAGRYRLQIAARKGYEPTSVTHEVNGYGSGGVMQSAVKNGYCGLIIQRGSEIRLTFTAEKVVRVNDPPVPSSIQPDPAVVQPLRELVAAKERTRDIVKKRVEAGADSMMDLMRAEVELSEAQIRLADAEGNTAVVVARLQELVAFRQKEKELTTLLVRAGRLAANELNDAAARLADAETRLAKARGAEPAHAVAPFDAAKAKEHQEAWAKYLGVPVEFTNSAGMKLRVIPPGKYLRGSTAEEMKKAVAELGDGYQGVVEVEAPQHSVILDAPFALGVTEVTRGQFRQFVKETGYKTEAERGQPIGHGVVNGSWERRKEFNWDTNPGYRRPLTDADPVVNVTWNDAMEFCRWLSAKEGRSYTLPTEGQWEFACRAGTQTPWWTGDWADSAQHVKRATWYDAVDTVAGFRAAGSFDPNPFGLYDMHGNVEEWCSDWYREYTNDPVQRNPTGPAASTTVRSVRSSNFNVSPAGFRSAYRLGDDPNMPSAVRGFRVAIVGNLKPIPHAAAPFDAEKAKEQQETWAKHLATPVEVTNSVGMKLRLIPPGKFPMTAEYSVTIGKPFRIAAHEVTVRQFLAFVDDTGHKTDAEKSARGEVQNIAGERFVGPELTWRHKNVAQGDEYPVGQVTWNDAAAFCEWLSRKENKKYRLPTEAEWEWACRSGSLAAYHFGDDPAELAEHAWFAGNSRDKSHPVGSRKPNAWGLFDMHGNMSEHCLDWFEELRPGSVTDPRGPGSGSRRVLRGYSFIDAPQLLTSGQRTHVDPAHSMHQFGFRVVCEIGPE